MKLKDAFGLEIGEYVTTKSGINGKIISKIFIGAENGLGETIWIKIETKSGIYECTHKEVKCQ